MKIAVYGLGKIGLSLVCVLSNHFKVSGIDIDKKLVENLNSKAIEISEPGIKDLLVKNMGSGNLSFTVNPYVDADVRVIIVPTLVNNKIPDLSCVETVLASISKVIKKGDLIIFSSTMPLGSTRKLVKKYLENNLKMDLDFNVLVAPERISSGSALADFTQNYPQVIGGNENALIAGEKIYSLINKKGIVKVSSLEAAELVKLSEMIHRYVNIAFANELYLICEKNGINPKEVIDAANTNKPNTNILKPGIGVGGHCLPVYPYFLTKEEPSIIQKSCELNESMPKKAVKFFKQGVKEKKLDKVIVGVLGITYKAGIKEDRFSPFYDVISELKKENYEIFVNDPLYSKNEIENKTKLKYLELKELLKKCNSLIIITENDEYKNMKLPSNIKLIIDGRKTIPKDLCYKQLGI